MAGHNLYHSDVTEFLRLGMSRVANGVSFRGNLTLFAVRRLVPEVDRCDSEAVIDGT